MGKADCQVELVRNIAQHTVSSVAQGHSGGALPSHSHVPFSRFEPSPSLAMHVNAS